MMRRTWVSGPIIDVTLGSPQSDAVEPLQAIIDTGASVVCVDSRIAERLALEPVNRKLMQMTDGSEVVATSYLGRLRIRDLDLNDLLEVYAVPMAAPSRRMLLGRSFLRRYIVTYNGLEEHFYYEHSQPGGHLGYEDWDG